MNNTGLHLKSVLKRVLPQCLINVVGQTPRAIFLRGVPRYKQDGLVTIHNCEFMKDNLFREAYNLGEATGSFRGAKIHWRVYVACWAAHQVKSLEGDYVECGVYRGGLSRAVMHYIEFDQISKKFYLLDTFCGLSGTLVSDEEEAIGRKAGGYEECYEDVKKTFEDFSNVRIIKGIIPDTLVEVKAEKVAFLSIDMNCAAPEIAAAEYFWERIVTGGIIVLDDYNYCGYEPQMKAFDEFALKRGVQVLALPTGQGLIIKP